MTNEQHNRYVAYSFFAYAGFQTFWLLVMILWFTFIFGSIPSNPGGPDPPPFFFGLIFALMSFFFLIFALPAVIAGWAMLKRKPWARIAGIAAGVLAAMSAPVGTAACVYSLWFWLGDNWKSVYADQSMSERSVLGLQSSDEFQSAEGFSRTGDWTRQPPDWR